MSSDLDQLRLAGSRAVRFNAPMNVERADRIASFLGTAESVIDLGCGRGELLIHCVGASETMRGRGIDTDSRLIELAESSAATAELRDRMLFEVGDAENTAADGPDGVICVGVTHIFGGLTSLLRNIAATGASKAVIGTGIWESHPSDELREMFGNQPNGIIGMGMRATSTGWTVLDASRSTLEEWEGFEDQWLQGVRAVGTPAARDFADYRAALAERYRGVLGFGWLRLRR